ncbi:hypothetical protein [uncultured Microbacterium sp.]|uniref:hypothetical protein n=1 Tax=uncultured Microbacterium sp. TaxID=191216 RepID=UPI002613293B|nr:hypothetical protein [uncultured Microbacterium sp.]
MSRTAEHNDRRLAAAWRESVAGYLAAELRQPIRPRHPHRLISEEIGDVRGDVLGLDGLTFRTSYGRAGRLSESLDHADMLAVDRGDGSRGVVVQRRVGRETSGAYVVLSLASFAALCARLTAKGTP